MAKNDTKSKADDVVDGPNDPDIGASAVLSDGDETAQVAKEYDKSTEERLQALEDDVEELDEGVQRRQGSILVDSRGDLGVGVNTTYPGISARLGTTDAAVAVRRAKELPETGIVAEASNSWTAQSAAGFTPSNATQVPGQTFTSEELPDPNSVANSNLPAFAIPAGLVVDPHSSRPLKEDSLNGSQEGGDLATAPQKSRVGAADQAPVVSSISPTSGPTAGGTSVTLTGTNLTGSTGATVGGTAATAFSVTSSTQATFTTPAGTAGAKAVVV